MVHLSDLLPSRRVTGEADGESSGYYVATHTWTPTPNAPRLSLDDMYEALDGINDVYPEPAERRSP
ncbi:hypothetical protein [Actinosynnema sp. NPDC023587]|uniref:hypothetical protein n=1 Tax=Actinosynnema sp. NPDC023587 TaxID=3154695 RepID=UPI0033D7F528